MRTSTILAIDPGLSFGWRLTRRPLVLTTPTWQQTSTTWRSTLSSFIHRKPPPQPEGNSRGFLGRPHLEEGQALFRIIPYQRQKKAPAEAGAVNALGSFVPTGHSKSLPLFLAKRLPKLRIGGLHPRRTVDTR